MDLSFASRSLEKAEAYKDKYRGYKAYGSYDDAIDAAEHQIFMINTPPDSHFALAKKAIDAGKHVIVEKPPFLSSKDFDVLGPLADTKGVQLMIAENYYYKPLRPKLQTLLASGLIGTPLFMNINATKMQISKNDWRENEAIVGFGALYEGGIHWISLINNLGFETTAFLGHNPIPQRSLDRSMQLTSRTKEGLIINLFYSWEVDTMFKGLRLSRIFGTEGSITFETNGIFILVRGQKTRLMWPGLSDIQGVKGMFSDFFQAIQHNKAPLYTWRMAQRDLFTVEEAYRTASL